MPANAATQQVQQTQLAGRVELARLVDLSAARLGYRLEYDPKVLSGAVTLRSSEQMSDSELWTLTNRLLAVRDLTTIQQPGEDTLSVVRIQEAPGLARLESADLSSARAGFVQVLVPVGSANSAEVNAAVKALLSRPHGAVQVLNESGSLLISDLKSHVEQALTLIEQLKVQGASVQVRRVALRHRSSVQAAAQLEQIQQATKLVDGSQLRGKALSSTEPGVLLLVAPDEEVQRWQELIAELDQPTSAETRTYRPGRYDVEAVSTLLEELLRRPSGAVQGQAARVVTNELTGTLIVTASTEEHAVVEALIESLSGAASDSARPLRSYPIKNRRVQDVLTTLQELVGQGALSQAAEASGDGGSQPRETHTGAVPSSLQQSEPVSSDNGAGAAIRATGAGSAPVLTVDEATNSILVFGELWLHQQVEDLISKLDVRPPQLLVEAIVVSLSDSETLDLGVELRALQLEGGTLGRLSSIFGLGSADPASTTLPPNTGTGGTAVILDPGEYSAAVRALQRLNDGRTLSIPQVLVNNNEEAQLQSVLESPFTSTNASTTVATTSFGGSSQAGTIISVRPQLASGDQVLLDYSLSLSSFVGASSDPTLPPPRQENSIDSVVSIPNGFTVVVGGLEVQREGRSTTQVPFLGSIPFIGRLFKTTSESVERTRFFVFLRVRTLRDSAFRDLRYLSDQARGQAAVPENWPSVTPQIVR